MKDQRKSESDECEPLLSSEVRNGLLSQTSVITGRHLLVLPVAFLFMTAYKFSFNTFFEYVYIQLQRESFPNITLRPSTTPYCGVDTNSTNYKIQEDVQQEAAKWDIYFCLAGGFSSIIANFVMGTFTDRLGRKFLFILPCIGTIFRTVWAIVGMIYDLPLYYYVLGYFVEGGTGQVFNIMQVSYIYVSDITVSGKQRSIAIVIIELAFGIAESFPVGFIIEQTNSFIFPLYISLGLLAVTLFLVILLPETFPAHVRTKRKYISRLDNLKDSWGLFFGKENTGKRWMYITTLLAFILASYSVYGRTAIEDLYLLNYPFCWHSEDIDLFGALQAGCQPIAGMALAVVLHRCLKDEVIAILGCISYGASFMLEAFATTNTMMYIVTAVGTCSVLTTPMIRAIMSKMTSPQKQGAVFGAIAAAETGIYLIGTVTSQSIYIATVKVMRGFNFMVFAGFTLLSIVLLIIFSIGSKQSEVRYIYFDINNERRPTIIAP